MKKQDIDEIRTYPCPDCYVCGTQGKILYKGLRDRLFGARGSGILRSARILDVGWCGLTQGRSCIFSHH